MQPKKRIEVVKVPKPKALTPRRMYARLCYFYPQYTLTTARKLPYRDLVLLIKEAERQLAARNYQLARIVSAPHAKDPKAVEKLLEQYKEIMNG